MRKTLLFTLAILLGSLSAGSALADRGHRHTHTNVGIGFGFMYDPFWGPRYPPPYYPPIIIERREPPVYIEQAPAVVAPPPANYWYFCPTRNGYYPYVKECPNGWLKVLPQPSDHP